MGLANFGPGPQDYRECTDIQAPASHYILSLFPKSVLALTEKFYLRRCRIKQTLLCCTWKNQSMEKRKRKPSKGWGDSDFKKGFWYSW